MNILSETATHKVESTGTIYTPTKADTERCWRDGELLRTDNWPNDRPPGGQEVLNYRVVLRDYPNTVEFPNGTRPTI